MYYSRVVTTEQRDEIYEIQAKFDKQIAELMEQVHTLQKQRDDEVRGVLTADQQQQVDGMVAEARKQQQALKDAKSQAKTASGEGSSEAPEEEDK